MNDLCIELQNKYDKLIDLIEKSTGRIWNYPVSSEDVKQTIESYQAHSLQLNITDYTKLGIIYIF